MWLSAVPGRATFRNEGVNRPLTLLCQAESSVNACRLHYCHQEPACGGAESLDSGVARPGSDLRQTSWNAEGRSKERGRYCSRMSLPQGDQARSVAQNAGFGPRAGPKSDM